MAIGLAWTALGGSVMYVEATQMMGDGKLTLTGQLGDVMKESANLAMNWLRSNARRVSWSFSMYYMVLKSHRMLTGSTGRQLFLLDYHFILSFFQRR